MNKSIIYYWIRISNRTDPHNKFPCRWLVQVNIYDDLTINIIVQHKNQQLLLNNIGRWSQTNECLHLLHYNTVCTSQKKIFFSFFQMYFRLYDNVKRNNILYLGASISISIKLPYRIHFTVFIFLIAETCRIYYRYFTLFYKLYVCLYVYVYNTHWRSRINNEILYIYYDWLK